MSKYPTWTEEEKQYLSDNWGSKSKKTIANHLERSLTAVEVMKNRLGLGPFLLGGDYVSWNQLQIALGFGTSDSYKMKSWVRNRNFPLHTKKVCKNSFKIVYIDEFWKWAENNKDFLDLSEFEENALGKEPEWAKQKRKHDIERNKKYIKTPWTTTEDERLKYLLRQYKHTYQDLSRMLHRTNGAIQRRILDLHLMERPVKVDNHIKWTGEELTILAEMISDGYGYEKISESIGKSSKAVRGTVYRMYGTENLDKARMIIMEGAR